jgi:hypothetical protein
LRVAIEDIGMELPATTAPPRAGPGAPDADELRTALAAHGGIVARVARQFDKDPKQVYRWVAAYGIDLAAYRR